MMPYLYTASFYPRPLTFGIVTNTKDLHHDSQQAEQYNTIPPSPRFRSPICSHRDGSTTVHRKTRPFGDFELRGVGTSHGQDQRNLKYFMTPTDCLHGFGLQIAW